MAQYLEVENSFPKSRLVEIFTFSSSVGPFTTKRGHGIKVKSEGLRYEKQTKVQGPSCQ